MKNTLFILFFSCSIHLIAQSTPETLIDSFFTSYSKNAGQAVKDLYATNKWMENQKEQVDKVVATVNNLTSNFIGDYYGYEPITSKKIGKSFVLYSYMVKYDRQPLRFTFQFYKPKNTWVLYAFSFDDDLDEELKEASKMKNLDLKETP